MRAVACGRLQGERRHSFEGKNKKESSGNDLLLHAVTHALPSALTSLTAGFGMGPGVTSSLKSPKDSFNDTLKTE